MLLCATVVLSSFLLIGIRACTFRQRWADFHALTPTSTSSMDSWFPHARALFASFGLVTYFDSCRQIEYGRLCQALINYGTDYELAQCRRRSAHPSASTNTKLTRLSHLSSVIDHLQRKALHQLDKMDAGMRNSVLLHESAISIYNCGLPLYLQLWSRSHAHPRLIRRFLTIRSGYLPRFCRNCKHFYPTLHHLLISCSSDFLKGARKTLRDDLRVMQFPLRFALSFRFFYLDFWAGSISYSLTGTCKTSGTSTGPYHHWTLRNGHTL